MSENMGIVAAGVAETEAAGASYAVQDKALAAQRLAHFGWPPLLVAAALDSAPCTVALADGTRLFRPRVVPDPGWERGDWSGLVTLQADAPHGCAAGEWLIEVPLTRIAWVGTPSPS